MEFAKGHPGWSQIDSDQLQGRHESSPISHLHGPTLLAPHFPVPSEPLNELQGTTIKTLCSKTEKKLYAL